MLPSPHWVQHTSKNSRPFYPLNLGGRRSKRVRIVCSDPFDGFGRRRSDGLTKEAAN